VSAPSSDATTPDLVVGRVIQDLTAKRLGRAFLPVAVLTLAGLARLVLGGLGRPEPWVLALGGPLTAATMLAYGIRGVQRAFGRPRRPWMSVVGVASLVPPVFGVYVLGWLGLREMARGGAGSLATGALLAALGVWTLLGWLRIMEVQRLADTMAGIGGAPGGGR
jgi:hypothetical protein